MAHTGPKKEEAPEIIQEGIHAGEIAVRFEDQPISAEVVRRQRKVTKEAVQKAKDEHVTLAWDDVFPKKPKERLRWLYKAFQACKEGRVKSSPLYDIVAHRKFLAELKGQVATDTLNLIRGNIDVFSKKQQKQLQSDNFELFRKYAPINVLDSDEDEADAPPLPPPPEVIIEVKDKKKRITDEERRRREREQEEEEQGCSDEDVESKRRRILSKGVERRVDPADGQAYTIDEFIEVYGGDRNRPPVQWDNASHSSFIYKS